MDSQGSKYLLIKDNGNDTLSLTTFNNELQWYASGSKGYKKNANRWEIQPGKGGVYLLNKGTNKYLSVNKCNIKKKAITGLPENFGTLKFSSKNDAALWIMAKNENLPKENCKT